MSAGLRHALGLTSALALAAATGTLSHVPYTPESSESALVRLSWRATGAFVEECRELSAEDLERLPAHMRPTEVCEGRVPPYRLRVALDGRPLVDELVHSAGARKDRPIYVYRDLPVRAGTYRLEVTFDRVAGPASETGPAGEGEREDEEKEPGEDLDQAARSGGAGERDETPGTETNLTPPHLRLDVPMTLDVRRIALVTYDTERRKLILAAAEPSRD